MSGDFSRFSWHSENDLGGSNRILDFACLVIATFKTTCDDPQRGVGRAPNRARAKRNDTMSLHALRGSWNAINNG